MGAPNELRVVLLTLGARIRELRMAQGMTQEAAAAASGIDYKRWQRLEAGAVNPTVQTLVRVADALGLSVWTVVEGPRNARGDA